MTIFQRLFSICVLLLLAACGGGGGSAGDPPFAGSGSGGGIGGGGGGGVVVPPTAADLVLVLSSSSISNNGLETVTATATALDANRNAVAAVPVLISVNSDAIVTPGGATTDTAGRLTATVGIGAVTTLRTITVTAVSGTLTRTAALQVQAGTSAAGQASLALAISSNTVTALVPATVTATLRNAQNAPIVGQVVLMSSVRGLSTLSAASALTDANGMATLTVRPAAGGLSGADEIQATASAPATSGASTALNATVGFNVTGAASALSVALPPGTSTTLRASTSPVDFTATVRDQAGNPVADQVVTFSAAGSLASVTPPSALTDANGRATTRVAPISAATNAAETLRASTTLAGRDLLGTLNVQLVAEVPSIGLTLSSSNISSSAPATARVTVLSAAGAAVAGTVVTFSSASNLAAFNPASATTDSNGVATTAVSPRLATSAGADLLRASATVTGITRTAEAAAQFTGTTSGGTPVLDLVLSSTSISAASPATVTATLRDAGGTAVAGQVVGFTVVRGLAATNIATALTDGSGRAIVVLSPAGASSAGADEITASASYAGAALSATRGFQVQATAVTLDSLAAATNPLSAYGQTTLTVGVTGASVASPVNVTLISACVSQGKATLSPATLSITSASTTVQYRDNGCGAVLGGQPDQIQAVVTATGASRSLALNVQPPAESSIAFVAASPEQIFLRGSGFTESSVVTFEVRDAAGNPLPGRTVELRLQTGAGGVTMEGRGVESVSPPSADPFTQVSNASGRVTVRVNSGTLPTPVRINARLAATPSIATVSSNLSVAVGLPSQLNFSLSQGTRNIEGYNIDGTPNTYQIIAADRSGNPVPAGTSINLVAEGGQIEAIKQIQLVNGIARTTANFVSAEPRPVDGRVTVTVYALGEESFLDLNGNNTYDSGEPFQDLGNIFQDRNYNGSFQALQEEFIPLAVNNNQACAAITNNLLLLDASIPSAPASCSGNWSGAGQVYVRRAVETVLSTSSARPLWGSTSGLADTCSARALDMQIGPETNQIGSFVVIGGRGTSNAPLDTWYANAQRGTLSIVVADANPGRPKPQSQWIDPSDFNPLTDYDLQFLPRLNPMAAGTTISASTPSPGLTVLVGGGTPVGSTTAATGTTVAFEFTDTTSTAVQEGTIFVTFTSPSGLSTTVTVPVSTAMRPSVCPR
jgi:Bacterial Ig-like domain (group 1)